MAETVTSIPAIHERLAKAAMDDPEVAELLKIQRVESLVFMLNLASEMCYAMAKSCIEHKLRPVNERAAACGALEGMGKRFKNLAKETADANPS